MKKINFTLLFFILFLGCTTVGQDKPIAKYSSFGEYWFGGKAEITRYTLYQARYGEIHEGNAVTIFVTEDFSDQKHVKLDFPRKAGADNVPVLKLNLLKRFTTGIYDYSMMESVFSPTDVSQYPHALKVTASSQDWCGHTFTQLNTRNNQYQIELRSYFEREGDQRVTLEQVLLEDEILNQIRINPKLLPKGDIQIIPGLLFQRLRHIPLKIENAKTSLTQASFEEQTVLCYQIEYNSLNRILRIYYQEKAPHEIVGWEDTYTSGFSGNAQLLTTKAVKDKTVWIDYWNKNSLTDSALRKELGF